MGKYTKIPADSFEKLQLNAGILLRRFEPKTATVTESDIIGATSEASTSPPSPRTATSARTSTTARRT